jgi:Cu+-exporting ATPase
MAQQQIDLQIGGMTCAACSARLERVLNNREGVEARVNLASERARLRFDVSRNSEAELIAAIERAGFSATPITETSRTETQQQREAEMRHEWRVFWIAALLALPLVGQMLWPHAMLPGWLQWALATPVQFWAGARFYRDAFHSLRGGSANMAVLVALGTTAAWGLSTATWLLNLPGHLYFEAGAAVIVLVRLGKLLETRAKSRTSSAIEQLLHLTPDTALVERDGQFVSLPVRELHIDDRIRVRAGERIPVDGIVLEGVSTLDEAMLTGESMPIAKTVGDRVSAGTQNLNGSLLLRAECVGSHTQLMEIIRLTEAAQGSRPPIQALADRISAIFVPVVIGIAVLTFCAWWWISGDLAHSLIPAIAVLVIACPCALGLATPAAVTVGLGRAAQHGILFRNATALETASRIQALALDKTGTLTCGRPELVALKPAGISADHLLRWAAALESGSSHPLASAIVRAAPTDLPAVSAFRETPGLGVEGNIDGNPYRVQAGEPDASHPKATWLALWQGERLLGRIALADPLRSTSALAVSRLKALDIELWMLTGDNPKTAEAIAHHAGITHWQAGIKPQDKLAHIAQLKEGGKITAMAGDGINDAPALAAADISFSLAAGSDIALEAADITLMRDDLNGIADAIDLSRATLTKIRQNLFFAFAYNAAAIPLAAAGLLNPVIAGAAMAMSSVSVVSNALLLKRWRPH